MIKQNQINSIIDPRKGAQAMVAMLEGGDLLMKNQLNIHFLTNVIDVIRKQFHLS
jgi:TetR/AcrR family transcriptional regulator, transcriptional repressor for nem operon